MTASRTREARQLATFIMARRKELGLTRIDVARRAGLNPSSITRLEEGVFAHPSPHTLQAIGEALDSPRDELFTLAGWMPKTKPLSRKPHVRVTCHQIPSEVAREIQAAIDSIAKNHGITLDTYHESVNGDHRTAA